MTKNTSLFALPLPIVSLIMTRKKLNQRKKKQGVSHLCRKAFNMNNPVANEVQLVDMVYLKKESTGL
jgi:hypothetical protein